MTLGDTGADGRVGVEGEEAPVGRGRGEEEGAGEGIGDGDEVAAPDWTGVDMWIDV